MHQQVFKVLYYWGESREKLMEHPYRVLRQGLLAGHAFMMHPYKLSGAAAFLSTHVGRLPVP